jgi:hypothetical protein
MFKRMELETDADWMRNRERQYASVKALSFLEILEKVKRTRDAVSKLEHLLVAARAEIAAAAEEARAFSIAAGAAKLIYETASAKAKEAAAAARISSSTIRVKRHRSKRRASELKGLKSDIKRQSAVVELNSKYVGRSF